MSAWKPTDEQIEALVDEWHEVSDRAFLDYGLENVVVKIPHHPGWSTAHDLTLGPAFQSIIRAAQAEAWDEGYGDDNDVQTPRKNPYRSES